MTSPFLQFAEWCHAQVSDWNRQDAELDDALAHLPPGECGNVDWLRIRAKREKVVADKARELGLALPDGFA